MPQQQAGKAIQRRRDQGDRIIGCFPLYPPVELFSSMGLFPVVLWGLKSSVKSLAEADKHVQNYACAIGRELIEFVLSDSGSLLDGIFHYNACDTLRNFPEIVQTANREYGGSIPVFGMHVPQVKPEQTDPQLYLKNEIAELVETIERAFGSRFSPQSFRQATEAYSVMRALCLEAESRVAAGALSFGKFCATVLEGYFEPVDEQLSHLENLIAGVDPSRKAAGPGVLLSGIMPPPAAVVREMERTGLRVVANDIASLRRTYGYSPAPGSDPGAYYSDFFANHFPCSTLLYQSDDRVDALIRLVKESGAQGVIFCGEKFCEYEYFEFPYLEKRLSDAGTQSLFLEFGADDELNVAGYITRIQAFSEMLEGRAGRKGAGI
jgi:benzoyl-CoA reductase/2-hydroxyglutaryl-CoA dehydratase subunit BcrC/BadD/HgdB